MEPLKAGGAVTFWRVPVLDADSLATPPAPYARLVPPSHNVPVVGTVSLAPFDWEVARLWKLCGIVMIPVSLSPRRWGSEAVCNVMDWYRGGVALPGVVSTNQALGQLNTEGLQDHLPVGHGCRGLKVLQEDEGVDSTAAKQKPEDVSARNEKHT